MPINKDLNRCLSSNASIDDFIRLNVDVIAIVFTKSNPLTIKKLEIRSSFDI